MSKTIKQIFISIFATLLIFCTVFLLYKPPILKNVSADGTPSYTLSDDNFTWSPEVKTNINAETERNALSFTLKLKNLKLNNLLEYAPPVWGGIFGGRDYYYLNYYVNEFKLYRLNADKTAVSPVSILIGYDYYKDSNGNYGLNYTYAIKKSDNVAKERIEFVPTQDYGSTIKNGDTNEWLLDYINDNGYTHISTVKTSSGYHTGNDYGLTWGTNPDTLGKEITLNFLVNSSYTNYFMEFSYYYYYPIAGRAWGTKDEVIKGTIKSPDVSVASLLKEMDDEGVLQNFCVDEKTYNYAMGIITSGAKKEVKISYLEPIPNSDFAKKVTKTVNVPVYKGSLALDDIYAYLNVKSLDVLDSQLYEFVKNENDTVYNAYYLPNIWLRPMTTDGKYNDYFLDINLSYEETYGPFVDAGIISQELYEYIFGKMIEDNPGAKGCKYDEIYGYFGFVAIPTTYSLNTLWVKMFDVKTSKHGILCNFSYEYNLSFDNYTKLLNEYKYGWLAKAWNGVTGFVSGSVYPATFYMFYSKPGTENAYIGEGGQKDPENPSGAMVGGIKDGIKNGFSKLKDFVSSMSGDMNKTFGLFAICMLVFGVYMIKRKNKKNKK